MRAWIGGHLQLPLTIKCTATKGHHRDWVHLKAAGELPHVCQNRANMGHPAASKERPPPTGTEPFPVLSDGSLVRSIKVEVPSRVLKFHLDALLSKKECEDWLRGRERVLPDALPENAIERVPFPDEPYRVFFFAHWIATSLTYRRPTLLWIKEWDIWPSSENWHLYYRLRQSYGDQRLLHEAPGHLFLGHESEDLASSYLERLGRLCSY
jgi:hypothetical protein